MLNAGFTFAVKINDDLMFLVVGTVVQRSLVGCCYWRAVIFLIQPKLCGSCISHPQMAPLSSTWGTFR